jgi:predicted  nucleic acid-binding Zn-ribbon protein
MSAFTSITARRVAGVVVLLLASYWTTSAVIGDTPRDVVAPVGTQTRVDIQAPRGQQLTIDKRQFAGKATLLTDERTGHIAVAVVPDVAAVPTEIAVMRGAQVFQTLRILPVALAQEEAALESFAPAPDSTSRDYMTFTQRTVSRPGVFNGKAGSTLRQIQISGHRIVIEPKNKQGIYERLMPSSAPTGDVQSLEIFAKSVVIAAPLQVPGASVHIYAETLEFQDRGNVVSRLDTTPQQASKKTDARVSGDPGQNGSEIFLHLARPVVESSPGQARIVANGAQGQEGGPGTTGGTDTSVIEMPKEPQIGGIVRSWRDLDKVIQGPLPPQWGDVYAASNNVVWFKRGNTIEFGRENKWPADGAPGNAAGTPGAGGAGGHVHSTVAVPASMIEIKEGPAGPQGAVAPGGAAGPPNPALGIWIEETEHCHGGGGREGGGRECSTHARYHIVSHSSTSGPSTPAPAPPQPRGANGQLTTELRGWFHPVAARAMLSYAEDLYRMGLLTQAQAELTSLASAIEDGTAHSDPVLATYLATQERSTALLARLSVNRDFFGNPAGWVPPLDLPATIRLLDSEVDSIAPILMVTEQVRRVAENGVAAVASIESSRTAAAERITKMEKDLNDFAVLVPDLQRRSGEIAQREDTLRSEIRSREETLRRDAEDQTRVGFLKGALKTLGSIVSVCPVGQPLLGGIGTAMNFVANIGEQTPWDTIAAIPSVAKGFSAANISTSVQSYKNLVAGVKSLDPGHPQQFFSQIQDAARVANDSLSDFRKRQDAARVPASQVEAVLQKLKAEDPSLNDLVQRVTTLTNEKTALAKTLDQSIAEMGELTSSLTTETDNLDALTKSLVDARDVVDHPATVAAAEVSRALRERLDYFHYLVIKAYEYYTSQPYGGNRRAAGTAESIFALLEQHGGATVDAAQTYAAVYKNEVHALGRSIVDLLAQRGIGARKDVTFVLNRQDLDVLNNQLRNREAAPDLILNLEDRGLLLINELEARLAGVEVTSCDCRRTSGNQGSATIQLDVRNPLDVLSRTPTHNLHFRFAESGKPWGATVDLTRRPVAIAQITAPDDVGRLLAVLLGAQTPTEFLTAPPAMPGIALRVHTLPDPPIDPFAATIDGLTLKLTYHYRQASNVRAVRVTTQGADIAPYYYVGLADDRQLQHAMGDFTRLYHDARSLEIVAPLTAGTKQFQGWYRGGARVQAGTHLVVPARNDSYAYEARYQ